jgi:hypothetical protein
MLWQNHNDLMAFTTPGESPLRYRQDNRKVSHGHENVAVIKEPTPQPGPTINLRAMPCGGKIEPNQRALAGAKSRGPQTADVRATLAIL